MNILFKGPFKIFYLLLGAFVYPNFIFAMDMTRQELAEWFMPPINMPTFHWRDPGEIPLQKQIDFLKEWGDKSTAAY